MKVRSLESWNKNFVSLGTVMQFYVKVEDAEEFIVNIMIRCVYCENLYKWINMKRNRDYFV